MRRVPSLERQIFLGRWSRLGAAVQPTTILVALSDGETRIRVAASLVAAGCRVIIARSAVQAAQHLTTVDAVVIDARIAGSIRGDVLRGASLVLLAGEAELLPDAPARLGAAAVFRAPFDVDDVVAMVVHAARWTAP